MRWEKVCRNAWKNAYFGHESWFNKKSFLEEAKGRNDLCDLPRKKNMLKTLHSRKLGWDIFYWRFFFFFKRLPLLEIESVLDGGQHKSSGAKDNEMHLGFGSIVERALFWQQSLDSQRYLGKENIENSSLEFLHKLTFHLLRTSRNGGHYSKSKQITRKLSPWK